MSTPPCYAFTKNYDYETDQQHPRPRRNPALARTRRRRTPPRRPRQTPPPLRRPPQVGRRNLRPLDPPHLRLPPPRRQHLHRPRIPRKTLRQNHPATVLSELVNRPVVAANISSSAFFRVIEETHPPCSSTKPTPSSKATTNSAASSTPATPAKPPTSSASAAPRLRPDRFRSVAPASPSRFSCWCPKIMAAIGHLPETLADRCIVIRMQRRTHREQCERLRNLDTVDLRRQCLRFVLDHPAQIARPPRQFPPDCMTAPPTSGNPSSSWRTSPALIGLAPPATRPPPRSPIANTAPSARSSSISSAFSPLPLRTASSPAPSSITSRVLIPIIPGPTRSGANPVRTLACPSSQPLRHPPAHLRNQRITRSWLLQTGHAGNLLPLHFPGRRRCCRH